MRDVKNGNMFSLKMRRTMQSKLFINKKSLNTRQKVTDETENTWLTSCKNQNTTTNQQTSCPICIQDTVISASRQAV